MPLKMLTPSTTVPRTLPADVSTIALAVSAALATLRNEAAGAPASSQDACLTKLLRVDMLVMMQLSLPDSRARWDASTGRAGCWTVSWLLCSTTVVVFSRWARRDPHCQQSLGYGMSLALEQPMALPKLALFIGLLSPVLLSPAFAQRGGGHSGGGGGGHATSGGAARGGFSGGGSFRGGAVVGGGYRGGFYGGRGYYGGRYWGPGFYFGVGGWGYPYYPYYYSGYPYYGYDPYYSTYDPYASGGAYSAPPPPAQQSYGYPPQD